MNKPVHLVEVVVSRPNVGTLARGPILAAANRKAVGAILGPLEVLPGDTVAVIATGRQPSVWVMDDAFSLGSGRGTFPQCALFYFPLDTAEPFSVDRSLAKYRQHKIDYMAGASDPRVRVVLP